MVVAALTLTLCVVQLWRDVGTLRNSWICSAMALLASLKMLFA